MSESSAFQDYKIIREYQRAHGGRLPGGSAEDMAALEAQDCQTLVDAMTAVGENCHRSELATPAARLLTWAYVDYMKGGAVEAEGPVSYFPSLDMEQMRRTA